jgi:PAS domain S-box-containing protein
MSFSSGDLRVASSAVPAPTRLLMVEDDPRDAELALYRLERAGLQIDATTVDNEADFRAALSGGRFDIIVSDFHLPAFTGSAALAIAKALAPATPFIVVSGMLGEERAVDMVRSGATDYVLKQRLERLPLVVSRALAEAGERERRATAEARLRDRESYFAQLVETLRDFSVCSLNDAGQIISWNAASERIFGYPAALVLGRTCDMFEVANSTEITPRDELLAARDAGSISSDRWLRRQDGELFHAAVVTTAIVVDGEPRGFSRIVRDTTDARLAADLLESAKNQAEIANRAKDRFLAVLSHELRSPLNAISAAVGILAFDRNLSDINRRSVELIQRNVRAEARLFDDLLDISRIVNDKLPLTLDVVDMETLLRNTADSFRPEAQAAGIALTVKSDAGTVNVWGDALRLQQILSNLLKNAIKFSSRGDRIEASLAVHGDEVHVRVTDTGIGISEADFPRIFVAFEQGDEDPQRQRGGLGLGLAIADSLARQHRGRLSVSSPGVGLGSSFTLTLPLHDRPISETQVEASHVQQSQGNLRILLVEDSEDAAEMMNELLSLMGYECTVAGRVSIAKRLLAQHDFDVLLCDMGLPDGDGIDVLKDFDTSLGQTAIAITGYGMQEDIQRSIAAGFSEHMTKPIDFDRLERALMSAKRIERRAPR